MVRTLAQSRPGGVKRGVGPEEPPLFTTDVAQLPMCPGEVSCAIGARDRQADGSLSDRLSFRPLPLQPEGVASFSASR